MNSRIAARFLVAVPIVSLAFFLAGCGKTREQPQHQKTTDATTAQGEEHTDHAHSHESHSGQHNHTATSTLRKLVVKTEPATPAPGTLTKLDLQILDEAGKAVQAFDITHEKLVHLIVVREGLDEFAHLHPDVSSNGDISQGYTFPQAGKYKLFADHQPKGQSPAVAVAEVDVGGPGAPPAPLVPNVPVEVTAGDVRAKVELAGVREEAVVRFRLVDVDGTAISDLQPYLGAMGHLVVISADGSEYVHAHPVGDSQSAPDGVVEFHVRFPKAGIYKGWGQFQRRGNVLTVPFVLEHTTH